MISQKSLLSNVANQAIRHALWLFFIFSAGSANKIYGQIFGAEVAAVCPASCGIKMQITKAVVSEANDGVLVKVDWTMDAPNPALKITQLIVSAEADLGLDRVKNSVTVAVTQRTANIKLSRLLEFDVKDVKGLQTKLTATAPQLDPIPVSVTSRSIVGQGNVAAVQVRWQNPGTLQCTAARFFVDASAINEKNDKLSGTKNVSLSTLTTNVDLKGAINKKGLHDPQANVKVIHDPIGCVEPKFFPAGQFTAAFGSGTGSNAPNPVVTLKPVQFSEASGRIDMNAFWDVVEPQGFKATKFEIRFDVELGNGAITTVNRTLAGNERSAFGPQAHVGDFKSVTVTNKATFTNSTNTTIETREDKRSQSFTSKSNLPKIEPLTPSAQNVGLSVAAVKINTVNGVHEVTTGWSVNPPAGVTITNFEVQATALGNQNSLTRSSVVSGQASLVVINFAFGEVGTQLNKVQVRVTATARRPDGSTFQQSVIGEGQPIVPAPAPQPAVQLKVDVLNAINSGSNFIINGAWIIFLPKGITVQDFLVEATMLKPTGAVKKSSNLGSNVRQESFAFSSKEAAGATVGEMKVTANLRRADGTTFQETSVRQTKVGN